MAEEGSVTPTGLLSFPAVAWGDVEAQGLGATSVCQVTVVLLRKALPLSLMPIQ